MANNGKPTKELTQEDLLEPIFISKLDMLDVSLVGKKTDEFQLHIQRRGGGIPSHNARYEFPVRFPERHEIKESLGSRWRVPATDVSALLINKLWPHDQISLTDDAGVVYSYLLTTLVQQETSVQRSARYHEYTSLRPQIHGCAAVTPHLIDDDFEFAGDLVPALHQRVARANSIGTDGYGLFMEQGTMKTGVVIGRIDYEAPRLKDRMYRVLIVAPKNVRNNWLREFERFSTVPGKTTVLRGYPVTRLKQLLTAMVQLEGEEDCQYTAVVCSYECLCNSWDSIGQIEWDLAVLDEAHYIKWPGTRRSKYAIKLRDVSRARMALTGTPVCNTPIDLFAQLEFLHQGGSGFSTFEAFRRFYGVFAVRDSQRGIKRLVDVQNLPFMRERLSRVSFIVRRDEALPDLPAKQYMVREVEMGKEQATLYQTVQSQLFLEIQREMNDETRTMNPNNVLVRLLRLAQITSGFVTFDKIVDEETGEVLVPKEVDAITPNPKIEELVALLKGGDDDEPLAANEKCIIWACWLQDLKTISERLKAEGINHVMFYGQTSEADRTDAEARFNGDPSCRVFLANPGAGGTGLNLVGYDWWESTPTLDTNTTMEVFFSQDWSNPKRSQAEDRACRRGQRQPVRIVDLCVPCTIDEEIRARVTNKRLVALQVQDLREVLQRVLERKTESDK